MHNLEFCVRQGAVWGWWTIPLYMSWEQDKRNVIKLPLDKFIDGMRETIFFSLTNTMGWLPWTIIQSTSLKAYTIRFCWLRKTFVKGRSGADNPSDRLCPPRGQLVGGWVSLNFCQLRAFTMSTWPWRRVRGLALGANEIQWHCQHYKHISSALHLIFLSMLVSN